MVRPIGRRTFVKQSAAYAAWALAGGAMIGAGRDSPEALEVAFFEAVRNGNLSRLRDLLSTAPKLIQKRNEDGVSPFALALLHGHRAVADWLRQRGYLPDLHESALARDWERFKQLAQDSPEQVNHPHPLGGTAMVAAALGGGGSQVWRVYAEGGDPNPSSRSRSGYSPLRASFEYPDVMTAESTAAAFLRNGADPNQHEPDGDSAMHAAAARGSAELVEMLIRHGASVDAHDANGKTALDQAIAAGHADVADRIRRHREIPRNHSTSRTAYDADGSPYRRPAMSDLSAVQQSRVVGAAHFRFDAIRQFVGQEARLAHSAATTTELAVEACAHTGRRPIVDFLLEHGAPYSLPTAAMRRDRRRCIELLDEDPLRIHERGAHDFALLWYAVIGGGAVEIAELFLERGARVEQQHFWGTTALHLAARSGQIEMAELLITAGADLQRVGRAFNPAGETPLQLAREAGHRKLAQHLGSRL